MGRKKPLLHQLPFVQHADEECSDHGNEEDNANGLSQLVHIGGALSTTGWRLAPKEIKQERFFS